ncbi:hypothetical protein BC835DRAFT_1365390 [Cytidiella melzeri]|nr:hypothetical protein BC835DRAFT_1365390 [Cytidiella melzeri]
MRFTYIFAIALAISSTVAISRNSGFRHQFDTVTRSTRHVRELEQLAEALGQLARRELTYQNIVRQDVDAVDVHSLLHENLYHASRREVAEMLRRQDVASGDSSGAFSIKQAFRDFFGVDNQIDKSLGGEEG